MSEVYLLALTAVAPGSDSQLDSQLPVEEFVERRDGGSTRLGSRLGVVLHHRFALTVTSPGPFNCLTTRAAVVTRHVSRLRGHHL
jgi:hypothetical protein